MMRSAFAFPPPAKWGIWGLRELGVSPAYLPIDKGFPNLDDFSFAHKCYEQGQAETPVKGGRWYVREREPNSAASTETLSTSVN